VVSSVRKESVKLLKRRNGRIESGNLDDCLAYFKEYPAFVDYVKENYQG